MKFPRLASSSPSASAAFGLFELLMAVMMLGILAMLSVRFYSVTGAEASRIVDRRNAKIIVATHRQAVMAGASFTAGSRDALIRELVQGVRPTGVFKNRVFRVAGLDEESLSGAARFLTMYEDGTLEFDPQAAQPAM